MKKLGYCPNCHILIEYDNEKSITCFSCGIMINGNNILPNNIQTKIAIHSQYGKIPTWK